MQNTRPTHGNKNIDVLVSDMVHLYCEPIIIQNVLTDVPDGQPGGGKRSDHPIVYSKPRVERLTKPAKEVVVKKTRRFKDAKIGDFAKWIQKESWEDLYNSDNLANELTKIVFNKWFRILSVKKTWVKLGYWKLFYSLLKTRGWTGFLQV